MPSVENIPMFGKTDRHFSNAWKNNRSAIQYSNARSSKTGLTLLEVMLAVVILGVGSATLLVATARCMAVAVKARHYSTARLLMKQVEAENPLTRSRLREGTESGSFDEGYEWEREISALEEEGREGLYRIRTRISWSMRGRQAFEELTTYRFILPEDEL